MFFFVEIAAILAAQAGLTWLMQVAICIIKHMALTFNVSLTKILGLTSLIPRVSKLR